MCTETHLILDTWHLILFSTEYINRTGLAPQLCTNGSYSPEGSRSCLLCPAGHSCLDPSKLLRNTYPNPYKYRVTPLRHGCEFALSVSGAAPVPCTGSTYNLQGLNTACTTCPSNSVSPGVYELILKVDWLLFRCASTSQQRPL